MQKIGSIFLLGNMSAIYARTMYSNRKSCLQPEPERRESPTRLLLRDGTCFPVNFHKGVIFRIPINFCIIKILKCIASQESIKETL